MASLKQKLQDTSAVIGVIGLGYIGLPLAVAFAEGGYEVIGIDKNLERVKRANARDSYIGDVSNERLEAVGSKFQATDMESKISECDAICICVPTPFTKTKDPDLQYVIATGEQIVKYMRHYFSPQLVVLESTTYPGTTREVLLPLLESSGLKVDKGFYLAFSPEMIDPGNKVYNLRITPKVIGGITKESTRLAHILYSQVCDKVVDTSSLEVAEMVKVFSNVFRNVNIALVNELAQLCQRMGISVWEIIDTVAKKPFGYMPFYPGFVGGHCIPKDPYLLAYKAREFDWHTKFIELAADINEQMPRYTLSGIAEALDKRGKTLKDANILVLGIGFKRDIADTRESGSIKLIELLLSRGAKVFYNDPYVPECVLSDRRVLESIEVEGNLSTMDCVVVATDHSCYDYEQIVAKAQLVYDVRGATRHIGFKYNNVVRLGE